MTLQAPRSLVARLAWWFALSLLALYGIPATLVYFYASVQARQYAVLTLKTEAEALASYASGTREWESAESDQYQVRLYGETAVLIGRWRAKGVNAGQAFDYAARFTAVYVKRDGYWQLVADQSTPITDL